MAIQIPFRKKYPLMFLAAMSSSRSDVVTQFVRIYVLFLGSILPQYMPFCVSLSVCSSKQLFRPLLSKVGGLALVC